MEVVGNIVMVLGLLVATVGGIWFLVEAFRKSALWGLGSLLLPVVSLVFLIKYWPRVAKQFAISVAGSIVALLGATLGVTQA